MSCGHSSRDQTVIQPQWTARQPVAVPSTSTFLQLTLIRDVFLMNDDTLYKWPRLLYLTLFALR